ncbi:hypothetical protein ACQWF4_23865, partial [Salmonella enterica subsp. enterica serovar Infantis]
FFKHSIGVFTLFWVLYFFIPWGGFIILDVFFFFSRNFFTQGFGFFCFKKRLLFLCKFLKSGLEINWV